MFKALVAAAACFGMCGPALAQWGGDAGSPIVGAWHGTIGNPADPIQIVKVFGPDGQFVIMTVNRGRPLKYWGSYTAQQAGPGAVRVAYNFAGYAPQQFCFHGSGCTPTNPPRQGMTDMLQPVGNGMLQDGGTVLRRGPVPPAVTQPMPATIVLPGALPMMPPNMVQRPTPTITPYTTPRVTPYNSQPAQDYIYQGIRECSPDYGTRHSYTNCQ